MKSIIYTLIIGTFFFLSSCTTSNMLLDKSINQTLSPQHQKLVSSVLQFQNKCTLIKDSVQKDGSLRCFVTRLPETLPKKQITPTGYWIYTVEKKDSNLKKNFEVSFVVIDFLTGDIQRGNKVDFAKLPPEEIIKVGLLQVDDKFNLTEIVLEKNKGKISFTQDKSSNLKTLLWNNKKQSPSIQIVGKYDPSTDVLFGKMIRPSGEYIWKASRLSSRIFNDLSGAGINPKLVKYVIHSSPPKEL